MKKSKHYWCGFYDGRPHVCKGLDDYDYPNATYYKYVELFLTRKAARVRYEDVRKVKIVEVK